MLVYRGEKKFYDNVENTDLFQSLKKYVLDSKDDETLRVIIAEFNWRNMIAECSDDYSRTKRELADNKVWLEEFLIKYLPNYAKV